MTNKRGRPKFVKSDRDSILIQHLMAFGSPIEHTAKLMQMSLKTLNKHFAWEIENGCDVAEMELVKLAYTKAKRDEDNMMIMFCLNRFERMREARAKRRADTSRPQHLFQISFEDGGPALQRATPYDPAKDSNRHTPAGRDALALPGDPVSTEIETAPGQVLLPKREVPKSVLDQFKALAPEGNRREPINHVNHPCCQCDLCIHARATFRHSHYVEN